MDGTILCEKPDYIEVALTRHRLLEKVKRNPQLARNPIYKAVIEGDAEYLYKNIKTAIAEAFEGESLKFYADYSRRFLSEEKHPRFNQPYIQLFYQPMIELIDYLKDFAFGNSSGDLAMLEVTAASGLPNLVCILDHDKPVREFEYHKSNLLKTATKNAWTVVSMKEDFRILFPFNH